MHVLYANTGVQIVCVPLPAGRRYQSSQIGRGWNFCRLKKSDDVDVSPDTLAFIQWQIIQSTVSKLFLAVDTSLGDPTLGYFSDASSLTGDRTVALSGMVGKDGKPLAGLPAVELCFRAASASSGEARPVHLVVDFGNSRTGALLLELSGEVAQTPDMLPFELLNRYALDAFNDEGEPEGKLSARWFSAKTRWSETPYLPARVMKQTEHYQETVKGLFGTKKVNRERQTSARPPLFDDLSMARMGVEADSLGQIMQAEGEFRTGVSSPKRYLWADDDSWLEGALWHMADAQDRQGKGEFSVKLAGPLLRFIGEEDDDRILEEEWRPEQAKATQAPTKPRHAPRTMMTAALYELLCQAYAHVNSIGYRQNTANPHRTREIRSLSLSFPSGMYQEERDRFAAQANKAIKIFSATLGKRQSASPALTLSIDEASAVHLTYIWSELQMLGQDPRLWFLTLSRDNPESTANGEDDSTADGETAAGATPAERRRSPARIRRPGRTAAARAPDEDQLSHDQKLRIACIDVGGGTTDLMIAQYEYQPGIDDQIHGQVLHQDGISLAGDQLVKRMLERIIVPSFAEAVGFEVEDVQLLFGPAVPKNRGFTPRRINWINHLFVPLAEAYLQAAEQGGAARPISHTDAELVDTGLLDSLEEICNKLRGPGYYNVRQPMDLNYDRDQFEDVVHEVFDDLLFDLCGRCVSHRADVILLAGQPTKIAYLQTLVRMYTPLPSSRIIPMHNHYAGNWYPYQDTKGHAPGVIVDPKSAVVVGAAIEFLARTGFLPQFHFRMRGKEAENSYYWGVMTPATSSIREERILFVPGTENVGDEWTEFETISQRVVIGRKMNGDEYAQASPIYVLKADTQGRIGPTELKVKCRRVRASDKHEEHLVFESVTGTVAGEPAALHDNVQVKWRTLADESYYLDTGGLDNIELGRL